MWVGGYMHTHEDTCYPDIQTNVLAHTAQIDTEEKHNVRTDHPCTFICNTRTLR